VRYLYYCAGTRWVFPEGPGVAIGTDGEWGVLFCEEVDDLRAGAIPAQRAEELAYLYIDREPDPVARRSLMDQLRRMYRLTSRY